MAKSLESDYDPLEHDHRRRRLSGIFRQDANVSVVTGAYYGVCPLVFRPLPARDSNGNPLPMRKSLREGHYSSWRIRIPVVKNTGLMVPGDKTRQGESFVLYNPLWVEDGYLPGRNPYIHFFNRIKKAAENKLETRIGANVFYPQGWQQLIRSSRPQIGSPQDLYYMRAIVYQNDESEKLHPQSSDYVHWPNLCIRREGRPCPPRGGAREDGAVLVEVKAPFPGMKQKFPDRWAESLDGALEVLRGEAGTNPSEDPAAIYQHPDVCSLTQGRWIYCYRASTMSLDPVPLEACHRPQTAGGVVYEDPANLLNAGGKDPSSPSDMEAWSYAVRDHFHYRLAGKTYAAAMDLSVLDPILRANYRSWDSVFDIADEPDAHDERLALLMARLFRPDPRMLEFGWLESDFFARPSVQAVLKNRSQHTVGPQVDIPEESPDTGAPFVGGETIPIDDLPPMGSSAEVPTPPGPRVSVTVPDLTPGSQAMADAALEDSSFAQSAEQAVSSAMQAAQRRSAVRQEAPPLKRKLSGPPPAV